MIDQKSIAVLPFDNLSSDAENEYFADGMTEEIINALSQIEGLKVTARTSTFVFKNLKQDIRHIGNELGVSTVLEGSIRKSSNRVRITAQLIRTDNGFHLWSENFDRELTDVFALQDEISLLIADKIRENFGHLEINEDLFHHAAEDTQALIYCQKARYHYNQWNPENINLSIQYYEKARALDDQLIDAYIGLADSYSFLAVAGFAPREEAWGKSIEAIEKAKTINAQNASLNYMLANQALYTEANFLKAISHCQQSLVVNPTLPEARRLMAFLNILRGDLEIAAEHLRYVVSIDPINDETAFFEAYLLYRAGKFEESEKKLRGLLDKNPSNLPAITTLAYNLIMTGQYSSIKQLLNEAPEGLIIPDEKLGLSCLAEVKERGQDITPDLLIQLKQNASENTSFQAHAYLFLVYVNLEELDSAMEVLQKLFDIKSSILLLSYGDPLAAKIFSHPSYEEIHKKIYNEEPINIPRKQGKSVSLEKEAIASALERLEDIISAKQPYLDPKLSLRALAETIELHPNQLSWLLNDKIGKNFNDFINGYRLAAFQERAKDPSLGHLTLLGLALESGFSSKSVFNEFFKKHTGKTPKAWVSEAKKAWDH
ncbi:MAG: helix-turn-helix domain-containing protein [Cytophagales bacterium]|nr:helix-turn-helix domain-containing protein [Cytophagales bacterium]